MIGDKKPLVLNDGQIQQLQSSDGLDIPLDQQVAELRMRMDRLVEMLILNGIELPDEVIKL